MYVNGREIEDIQYEQRHILRNIFRKLISFVVGVCLMLEGDPKAKWNKFPQPMGFVRVLYHGCWLWLSELTNYLSIMCKQLKHIWYVK